MKRTVACILILLFLLGLAGCAKGPDNLVGIVLAENSDLDTNLWVSDLKAKGYEPVLPTPAKNQADQMEQVRSLCDDGVKLLVIEAIIPSVADEISQPARQAGIPVLFVNFSDPAPALSGAVSFIGFNRDNVGTLQAELLKTLPDGGDLNGDKTVSCALLTGSVDLRDVQAQKEGITSVLGDYALLCAKHTDTTFEKGYANSAEILSTYGMDVEAIICGSPELTAGALQAANEAGIVPGKDIYIIGLGQSQELMSQIDAGAVAGTVYTDQEEYLITVSNVLFRMLEGDGYEYQLIIDPKVQ